MSDHNALFPLTEGQKLQKTVRILWWPNITFMKNLEQDSYIQVAKNQIELLNEIRDDLWHYMVLPRPVASLQFDNVTQWFMDFETYPPTMRSNFRVDVVREMMDNSVDFDLVMSHLPEHTHQLTSTLYNVTHHVPPVMGYCHWFDLEQVVAWPKDSFLQNITGLLEYDRCYVNTQHQKGMVLDQAGDTLNTKTVDRLDNILTVQHLGVNAKDVVEEVTKAATLETKTIVFNHRPDTYKHFKEFMAVCDRLWETRQDFKVWIPLLDKPNREYVSTAKFDKEGYYKELESCYVGFSPKQDYGGWSVSTTDGMMRGVPYLMYDAGYYHELNQWGDFFRDDDEAFTKLGKYLDDPNLRDAEAKKALGTVSATLVYRDEMVAMSRYMSELLARQKVMGDSAKFKEIVEYIRLHGEVRKVDLMRWLRWGRGIKWSPYRRALLNHPNIFEVDSATPTYCWQDLADANDRSLKGAA